MASSAIVVDGSYLEGGGQILRNSASLSCILGIPVTVNNIRAGRSKPGLRPQHLTGLQLIRDLCDGKLEGGEVGSTQVSLYPGKLRGGNFVADTHTAGSICLLMQAALPCLLYAPYPTRLLLKGGTNADMAPQIDYLTWVFQPIAENFGIRFQCNILRRGYFPKGGGEVEILCEPIREIRSYNLCEFGEVCKISGRAFVAGNLPIKVAQVMAQNAQDTVKRHFNKVPINIESVKEAPNQAIGTGTGIIIMAETSTGCRLAGSALGKKGVQAEDVGKNAGKELLSNLSSGGCVDEYLQDQLIILMALANGSSQYECGPVSLHTKTAIHIAETFTQAKFKVEQVTEDLNTVQCQGIGHKNEQIYE